MNGLGDVVEMKQAVIVVAGHSCATCYCPLELQAHSNGICRIGTETYDNTKAKCKCPISQRTIDIMKVQQKLKGRNHPISPHLSQNVRLKRIPSASVVWSTCK